MNNKLNFHFIFVIECRISFSSEYYLKILIPNTIKKEIEKSSRLSSVTSFKSIDRFLSMIKVLFGVCEIGTGHTLRTQTRAFGFQ